MKQLSQDVFNGAPDWVRSAGIDHDGEVYWLDIPLPLLRYLLARGWTVSLHSRIESAGVGFEYIEGEINEIGREVAK